MENNIQLKNVSFQYNKSSPLVLKNVNLIINKGEKIGILGKSGSGKTTLVDIIMGLLPPLSGKVLIDGIDIYEPKNKYFLRLWRNSISHVPQSIFLINNSIEQNIAFTSSRDNIDLKSIISASRKAQFMICFFFTFKIQNFNWRKRYQNKRRSKAKNCYCKSFI